MSEVRLFLNRIKATGECRPGSVKTVSMGVERVFNAYDTGEDTFIIERGIGAKLQAHPSVLIVEKHHLRKGATGRVMTFSSGNHAVSAFPLLDGRFWKISNLPSERRSEVLMRSIVCANIVQGRIELSQREVSTADIVRCDGWLISEAGFGMGDVVIGERNEATLDYYRRQGQEWRVKPLAWSETEMRVALAAAKKRISTELVYLHSANGVHFLTFPEFSRFAGTAQRDLSAFIKGLKELVGVYEGSEKSFTRMVKHRGHHEIEFFGLRRGTAIESLVPELERLLEAAESGNVGQLGIIQKTHEIVSLYKSLLTRPELADEETREYTETMYMYITGEIYSIVGEGSTPAFDDRRTALPGATFSGGRPLFHPGTDERSKVLLANLGGMLSKGELIEYANVYEVREDDKIPLGKGLTREIVYKTNMRPLEASLIEKGLSSRRRGYSEYMLARIGALRALGVGLSSYYKLLRRSSKGDKRVSDFYIRMRCDGETMQSIPASYYRRADGGPGEEREVVLSLAGLMGDAAAQNMAMKKFDPKTDSPLYGVGKEIYEFEYDIAREQVVPKRVATCSIRGSFGWPDLDYTDLNLNAMVGFYFTHYAHVLKEFQRQHTVEMRELAERFMSGFEFRTHAMEWQLSVMRDKFENFNPPVPEGYNFEKKWKFVMWSLERQERRLPLLRKVFMEKVKVVENEDLRNNPQ